MAFVGEPWPTNKTGILIAFLVGPASREVDSS